MRAGARMVVRRGFSRQESLRLSFIGTAADELSTSWAARSVLVDHRFGQVDARDIGDGGQPRKDISEFFHTRLVFAFAASALLERDDLREAMHGR